MILTEKGSSVSRQAKYATTHNEKMKVLTPHSALGKQMSVTVATDTETRILRKLSAALKFD
jgi:hypothetical protein